MSSTSDAPAPQTIHLVHVVAGVTLPLVVHGWMLGRHRCHLPTGYMDALIVRERDGGLAGCLSELTRATDGMPRTLHASAGRFRTPEALLTWLHRHTPAQAPWRAWWRHVLDQTEAAVLALLPGAAPTPPPSDPLCISTP